MSTLIKQMEGEAHPVSEAPQAESPTSPSTGQLAGPSGEQEALLWSRVKQHLLHAFSDRARVIEEGATFPTATERYEWASIAEEILLPEAGTARRGTVMRAGEVANALTSMFANLELDFAVRLALVLSVSLMTQGQSPLCLSLVLQGLRTSSVLERAMTTTAAGQLSPAGRLLSFYVDVTVEAVFNYHNARTNTKWRALVSFLDTYKPVLPTLRSLSLPSGVLMVRRMYRDGDHRSGGLLAAYLQLDPPVLHYELFQGMLEDKAMAAAVTVVERYMEVHGVEEVNRLGMGPALLQRLVVDGEWKLSHRLCQSLGLSSAFPMVEQRYREARIAKLVDKRKWRFAQAYLQSLEGEEGMGDCRSLKAHLVRCLIKADDFGSAMMLRAQLGVEDLVEELDPSLVAAHEQARAQASLHLPEHVTVLWVHDQDTLAKAHQVLSDVASRAVTAMRDGQRVEGLGMDVEWRPRFYDAYENRRSGTRRRRRRRGRRTHGDDHDEDEDDDEKDADGVPTSPEATVEPVGKEQHEEEAAGGGQAASEMASVLQVASRDAVLLFDLRSMGPDPTLLAGLDRALATVMPVSEVVKLGQSLKSDVDVLRRSWPGLCGSLSVVRGALEVSELGRLRTGLPTMGGLGQVCQHWLGRGLDKTEQISDWDRRPLTPEQVTYAALDAWALTAIFDQAMKDFGSVRLRVLSWSHGVTLRGPAGGGGEVAVVRPAEEDMESLSSAASLGTVDDLLEQATGRVGRRLVVQSEEEGGGGGVVRTKNIAIMATRGGGKADDLAAEGSSSGLATLRSSASPVAVVAVVQESDRVDLDKVSRVLGVARRGVRLATPQECEEVLGYTPGSIPAMGFRTPGVVVLVDCMVGPEEGQLVAWGAGQEGAVVVATREEMMATVLAEWSVVVEVAVRGGRKKRGEAEGGRGERRFLIDSTMGRLGKWLRLVGVDVTVFDPTTEQQGGAALAQRANEEEAAAVADGAPAILARAAREGRTLLTRDRKLAVSRWRNQAGVSCYLVSSSQPEEQFQEIARHFRLPLSHEALMSRCSKCNTKGFALVSVDEVRRRGVANERVLASVTEFWECVNPDCRKVFWEGPGFASAHVKFSSLVQSVVTAEQRQHMGHSPTRYVEQPQPKDDQNG